MVGSLFLVQFAFSTHGACKPGFEEFETEEGNVSCISIADSSMIGTAIPQTDFEYADYKEYIQLIVDQKNITTRVTVGFLSDNPQDLLIDPELEKKISSLDTINAIRITNDYNCGISEMVLDPGLGCVFVDVKRAGFGSDIIKIREETRKVADSLMYQDPNDLTNTGILALTTKFHSVLLGTSVATQVSEEEKLVKYGSENIATAIYTIQKYPTKKMFDVYNRLIIDDRISRSDGFIDTAEKITREELKEKIKNSGLLD